MKIKPFSVGKANVTMLIYILPFRAAPFLFVSILSVLSLTNKHNDLHLNCI